mmetsp:Transcript_16391/g.50165  ORF Transcript_16391/g.50165 Transcript_16391/m.50165 type:complete len:281 (+) Transcript_16391:1019-1861(+)
MDRSCASTLTRTGPALSPDGATSKGVMGSRVSAFINTSAQCSAVTFGAVAAAAAAAGAPPRPVCSGFESSSHGAAPALPESGCASRKRRWSASKALREISSSSSRRLSAQRSTKPSQSSEGSPPEAPPSRSAPERPGSSAMTRLFVAGYRDTEVRCAMSGSICAIVPTVHAPAPLTTSSRNSTAPFSARGTCASTVDRNARNSSRRRRSESAGTSGFSASMNPSASRGPRRRTTGLGSELSFRSMSWGFTAAASLMRYACSTSRSVTTTRSMQKSPPSLT